MSATWSALARHANRRRTCTVKGLGEDIPFVPNKKFGGVCLGGKIAPIFFNTQEDAGALAVELDVSKLDMGDEIELNVDHATGAVKVLKGGAVVSESALKNLVLLDEVRAGGRINLIIGRSLTAKAREFLGQPASTLFRLPQIPADTGKGYTLAQKMVGRACGLPEGKGMRPGTYCEPKMTSVGSQDTTGPMTRDELKDLACLGFSADLVMQSFCHTAAYPKPVDVKTHRELPKFIANRGGISLRPGDGIIHSRLQPHADARHRRHRRRQPHALPDRHQLPGRFRLLRCTCSCDRRWAPPDMPESVLVRFKGDHAARRHPARLVRVSRSTPSSKACSPLPRRGSGQRLSGRIRNRRPA